MGIRFHCGLFAAFWLTASALPARELITLRSGFQMEADSHTAEAGALVLRLGQGSLEIPADQVVTIDLIEDAKPAVPSKPLLETGPVSLRPEQILSAASLAQGLPAEFVVSVAKIESGLKQAAISHKGAQGLMQLMPATAAYLGVSAEKAEENALGGARYLRELLLKYKGNASLALAAYNAGPGAVQRYGGIPPYRETQLYVEKVLREYERQQKVTAAAIAQTVTERRASTAPAHPASESPR